MQIILASAKIMNQQTKVLPPFVTTPVFEKEAGQFAMELAQMPIEDLAKSLSCSQAIALENHLRYQSFFCEEEKMPALLAYFGQAYKYLSAQDLSQDEFRFAQQHLHILSFLYGMLRPLDNIHPYRLEGKVKLKATAGKNMFDWWKDQLTDQLISTVKADDGILLHLATEEFEHLFHWKKVERSIRVIKPLFVVDDGTRYKVVAMYAKGCRGAMARYVIKNQITDPILLKDFSIDQFTYQPHMGDAQHPYYVKNR